MHLSKNLCGHLRHGQPCKELIFSQVGRQRCMFSNHEELFGKVARDIRNCYERSALLLK